MGQRLIVEFRHEGDTILGLYQHWSAYTFDAFCTLKELLCPDDYSELEEWKKPKTHKQALLQAMMMASHIENVCWGDYSPDRADLTDDKYGWAYIKNNFSGKDTESESILELSESFCNPDGDRNDGLLFAGPEAENCASLGEYGIVIDLDDQTINFDVFCVCNGLEDFIDGGNNKVPAEIKLKGNALIDFFKFEDIPDMFKVVKRMSKGEYFYAENSGYDTDSIFGAIY